ncbi:hypothetical protein [Turicimonas sp. TL08]
MAKAKVYVGPRLPGLNRYSVFENGATPPFVKQMIKERPAIAGLIVNADALAQARLDITKKGHPLNVFYKRVIKE